MEISEALCNSYRNLLCLKIEKLENKVDSNKEIFDERVRLSDKALKIAQDILNARMESENKIREELREQTNSFITRNEYSIQHQFVLEKISDVTKDTSKLDGKIVVMIVGIPIVMSFLVSIVTLFIFHMVK